MPAGLEDGVPATKNNNPICFDHNFGRCHLPVSRGRCRKGLHICCMKGCHKHDHTYQNCPSRKKQNSWLDTSAGQQHVQAKRNSENQKNCDADYSHAPVLEPHSLHVSGNSHPALGKDDQQPSPHTKENLNAETGVGINKPPCSFAQTTEETFQRKPVVHWNLCRHGHAKSLFQRGWLWCSGHRSFEESLPSTSTYLQHWSHNRSWVAILRPSYRTLQCYFCSCCTSVWHLQPCSRD